MDPLEVQCNIIPSKLGGVSAMLGALLILLPLSFFNTYQLRSTRYRPILNILWIRRIMFSAFWVVLIFLILITVGFLNGYSSSYHLGGLG